MPDLLLELRSEEIPARMQRKAAGDLRRLVTDALVEAGLTYEGAQDYWTPRRLALDVRGLTARSRDVREEIKGPSVTAPDAAVQGFLRKAGLASVADAHVHADPKKGGFYVAHTVRPGRTAEEIIAAVMPGIIRDFPWPKSMRWGVASQKAGALRWVRPLQSILCTFGPETEEPVVVDFSVGGIVSGNTTVGHRFHAPGEIAVRRFEDYAAKLEAAHVVLDAERRKAIIRTDAANLAFANGLELVEDEALLEEVSGLVEWPVVLMGEFEEAFGEIPAEVIRLTIRANQKCFVTRSAGEAEALAPRFLLTANIDAHDGGAEIVRGNGKVVRARLSDALYFWRADQGDLPDLAQLDAAAEKFGLKRDAAGKLLPLDQRMARLAHLDVTFHAKLGTQGERVGRIRRLAREIAPLVGADPDLADRAAVLAKADLQTEVVGEFPELQGLMGRRYAALQGEHPSVATAIEEHYKPQGPSDFVPSDPVSVAVALADKLDTLVGFWAIDEKPTGSKDPYALRRAALGVIRIVVENGIPLGMSRQVEQALSQLHGYSGLKSEIKEIEGAIAQHLDSISLLDDRTRSPIFVEKNSARSEVNAIQSSVAHLKERQAGVESMIGAIEQRVASRQAGVIPFLHDRLKVYLRDQGARHDLIDAVLAAGSTSPLWGGRREASGGGSAPTAQAAPPPLTPPHKGEGSGNVAANDDLLSVVRRVEALGALLDTPDGRNLLAGTKRAANILAAEERKGTSVGAAVDPALFADAAEHALLDAVNAAERQAGEAIAKEDLSAAMLALAALREPTDAFFEKVLVNDEDAAVRSNRLALLARVRAATGQVADFSRIAG